MLGYAYTYGTRPGFCLVPWEFRIPKVLIPDGRVPRSVIRRGVVIAQPRLDKLTIRILLALCASPLIMTTYRKCEENSGS